MDLLSALIKERDLKFPKYVAECAEYFTNMNALQSSGFQLSLAELLIDELETKCQLFIDYNDEKDTTSFEEFFKKQESIRSSLKARFGRSIPSESGFKIIHEKYLAILTTRSSTPKPPIGFH